MRNRLDIWYGDRRRLAEVCKGLGRTDVRVCSSTHSGSERQEGEDAPPVLDNCHGLESQSRRQKQKQSDARDLGQPDGPLETRLTAPRPSPVVLSSLVVSLPSMYSAVTRMTRRVGKTTHALRTGDHSRSSSKAIKAPSCSKLDLPSALSIFKSSCIIHYEHYQQGERYPGTFLWRRRTRRACRNSEPCDGRIIWPQLAGSTA